MENIGTNAGAGIAAIWIIGMVITGIALVVAWIVLPFALIGTKGLLRQLIFETQQTNRLLAQLAPPKPPIAPPTLPAKETVVLR